MVENQTDEEMSLIHMKFWQKFDSDIKELKKLKWRRRSEEGDENMLKIHFHNRYL